MMAGETAPWRGGKISFYETSARSKNQEMARKQLKNPRWLRDIYANLIETTIFSVSAIHHRDMRCDEPS